MNLVIDIGNTLQKVAVFNHDECQFCQYLESISEKNLSGLLHNYKINYSIISSVAETDKAVVDFLNNHTHFIHFSHKIKLPINILYHSKETLGLDRIACAVGAAITFPSKNVLSIQAGTCLVFDFVNNKGEYLGGAISPGMKMRFETLHNSTKSLPLVDVHHRLPDFIGKDTYSSICCGVINGMCHEIEGFIETYQNNICDLIVVFTGGDAPFLQNSIKKTIFAAPNLVLKGLNEIIKCNV